MVIDRGGRALCGGGAVYLRYMHMAVYMRYGGGRIFLRGIIWRILRGEWADF